MRASLLGCALCCIASVAYADGVREIPDASKTPGAIATTNQAEVLARVDGLTYTKRHRVWNRQRETMAKYGVPWAEHHSYEDDDRVPVCLGGDNADPGNHWAQPSNTLTQMGYETKDIMDAGACRLLREGKVTLKEAQSWFLAPDWRPVYCQHFGQGDKRCPP